jgi:hypothetical protein
MSPEEEDEMIVVARPLVNGEVVKPQVEYPVPQVTPPRPEPWIRMDTPVVPDMRETPMVDDPDSVGRDPTHVPSNSPQTRCELEATPAGPPLPIIRTKMLPRNETICR